MQNQTIAGAAGNDQATAQELDQGHQIRLDFHRADGADTSFIGVYETSLEGYESGDLPEEGDFIRLAFCDDGLEGKAIENVVQSAVDAANAAQPKTRAAAVLAAMADLETQTGEAVKKVLDAFAAESRKHDRMHQFDNMLLARLQQDCEYYLGAGGRNKKHLWALDEREQIQKMRELFTRLPEKPGWITLAQIDLYEKLMLPPQGAVVYVIRSLSAGDEGFDGKAGAFWSNEDGWGYLSTATRFTTEERMSFRLPMSADSEWMLEEEAIAIVREIGQERQDVDVVEVAMLDEEHAAIKFQ